MSESLTRELIDRLAQVLGSTGPHVYEVLIQYHQTQPIAAFIATAIFSALLLVEIKLIGDVAWSHAEASEGFSILIGFIGVLVVGGLTLWTVHIGYEMVVKLMNPEYYAIETIIRTMRGK